MKNCNILDLIDGRNFHSCLMTTYSFDFFYFEKRMIRQLHSKNIKNINVFVDSGILDNMLGVVSGNEAKSRSYSLIPIKSNGCFHPKIYMFFGEKDGLLVVGSGNITSPGMGNNEEIWGAFRYDTEDKRYSNIFSTAIEFFTSLSADVKGFNSEKLDWIRKYSPWVGELPKTEDKMDVLDNGQECALLTSGFGKSIGDALLSKGIDFGLVKTFTVISPYYDERGSMIEYYTSLMPSTTTVNVVIEEKGGILPTALPDKNRRRFNFYRWEDCGRPDGREKFLHAKIFVFELSNGNQYCLFGSANASVAAFGIKGKEAINQEASLLMKYNGDALKSLGIKLNTTVAFEDLKGRAVYNEENEGNASKAYELWLSAIDRNGNTYAVYTDEINTQEVGLLLCNCFGDLCGIYELTQCAGYYEVERNGEDVMYGQLVDLKSKKALSNKQVIHDEYVLYRTNPSPERKSIDEILLKASENPDYLLKKLSEINLFDDEEKNEAVNGNSHAVGETNKKEMRDGDKEYVLTKEEMKGMTLRHSHVYDLENNRTGLIWDFLRNLYKEERDNREVELETEEELAANQDSEDARYGSDIEQRRKRVEITEFEKVRKYANKIFDNYFSHLERTLIKLSEKQDSSYQISYTELKKFCIILYIITNYAGKRYFCKDGEEKERSEQIIYIKRETETNSLCQLCLDIIDSFLLLAVYGFKNYNDKYIDSKVRELRDEAFYHCLFCIFNGRWNRKYKKYDEVILVNAIKYLAASNPVKLSEKESIKRELDNIYKNHRETTFECNSDIIADRVSSILERYIAFENNVSIKNLTDIRDVNYQDIVLVNLQNAKGGFCLVEKIKNNNISFYRYVLRNYVPKSYLNKLIKNKVKMFVF